MILSQTILLHKQIEKCRLKLYSLVKKKGVVNDPEVIDTSRELDELIVSLQKIILCKSKC